MVVKWVGGAEELREARDECKSFLRNTANPTKNGRDFRSYATLGF